MLKSTNRFHVAVDLFSNRSQMTSKCGKNKEVAHHRQPKRTIIGFGIQRSFGRNILELIYYLMPINAKILKIRSLLVCLSVLVAFKITKVDISCIITCDSGPYCSNFITCQTYIRIYNAKRKNHDHAKY